MYFTLHSTLYTSDTSLYTLVFTLCKVYTLFCTLNTNTAHSGHNREHSTQDTSNTDSVSVLHCTRNKTHKRTGVTRYIANKTQNTTQNYNFVDMYGPVYLSTNKM